MSCGVLPLATISFVNAGELARQIGADGDGIVVSQVVPIPGDPSSRLVQRYQQALGTFGNGELPDFAMLEGYLMGYVACKMLHMAGPTPTRESYLATLFGQSTSIDLGDIQLQYGPGDNRGSSSVFLSRLMADGGYRAMDGGQRMAA